MSKITRYGLVVEEQNKSTVLAYTSETVADTLIKKSLQLHALLASTSGFVEENFHSLSSELQELFISLAADLAAEVALLADLATKPSDTQGDRHG
ncbi:hypothetical protein ACEU07_03750 [Chromobacterium violaceum]|uniref:hypothetical protein n=1 Tax=Chromobacterium violaceum TaxID=536 RepID=UPI0035A58705